MSSCSQNLLVSETNLKDSGDDFYFLNFYSTYEPNSFILVHDYEADSCCYS